MIWRHELKYLIDEATFRELYYQLRPIMHPDYHAAAGGQDSEQICSYQIRSLYFDDYGRQGVFAKLAGVDPRHKYRIRIYGDGDQVIHLEKKIKAGSLTQKQSCPLTRSQVECLLAGDPEPLIALLPGPDISTGRSEQLIGQFYAEWQTRLLRPLLLVDYDRIPLVWPDGNVRITFDRHLATGFYRQDLWDPGAGLQPVLDHRTLILEVKYDHFLPEFIRALIPLAGASPLAVSKYTQCATFCRQQSWEDQT
ncbi:MAG: polyphosphate polymerase domain-containing protein [Clostridiaceae bacterium]|nr:polyphosphate polymerase domain-containing protein [Clostridiaceae bacterium]